jgi:hypothetical protein
MKYLLDFLRESGAEISENLSPGPLTELTEPRRHLRIPGDTSGQALTKLTEPPGACPSKSEKCSKAVTDRTDGTSPFLTSRWGPALDNVTPGITIDRPDPARMRVGITALASDPEAQAEREAIRWADEQADRVRRAGAWLIGYFSGGPRQAHSLLRCAILDRFSDQEMRAAADQLGVSITGGGPLEIWALPAGGCDRAPAYEVERAQGVHWAADRILQDLDRILWDCLTRGVSRPWGPPLAPPAWCSVLGLPWPHTAEDVKAAYRRLAKAAHPDCGGNAAEFHRIESAYRTAMKALRSDLP